MDKSNAKKPGKMERSKVVSPYLLRRLRSVDQVIEERQRGSAQSVRWEAAGNENQTQKAKLQSL